MPGPLQAYTPYTPQFVNPQDLTFGGWNPSQNLMPTPTVGPGSMPTGTAPTVMAPTFGSNFGFNVPTAQLALSGLGTLGSLWGAFQSAKLAKKNFNYTKDVTESNLANQIKSYNTSLEDRIRSRAAVEGMSPEQAASYLDRNRLTRNNSSTAA
jgi:hypothetical protein